jgi:serine phosphatase RsbU (regulator of sigma subunit)
LLDDINATLYNELEAGMFVTMLVVVLEPRSGIIEIASAGHPAPLVRGRDGEVRQLAIDGGPPLGAMSEPRYPVVRHQLEPGECMLLFTDGLDEAHNQAGELFGLKRAQTAVARGVDARGVINALRDDLARFVGAEPQSDDLTLLAIERL